MHAAPVLPAQLAMPVKAAVAGPVLAAVPVPGGGAEEWGSFAQLVPAAEPAGEEAAAADASAALPEEVEGLPVPAASLVWAADLIPLPVAVTATAAPPAGLGREFAGGPPDLAAGPARKTDDAAAKYAPAREPMPTAVLAVALPPTVADGPDRRLGAAESPEAAAPHTLRLEKPLPEGLPQSGQAAPGQGVPAVWLRPVAAVGGGALGGDVTAVPELAPPGALPLLGSAAPTAGGALAEGGDPPVGPAPTSLVPGSSAPRGPFVLTPPLSAAAGPPLGQGEPEPGPSVPLAGGAPPDLPVPGETPAPVPAWRAAAEAAPPPRPGASTAERLWFATYQPLPAPVRDAAPLAGWPVKTPLPPAESPQGPSDPTTKPPLRSVLVGPVPTQGQSADAATFQTPNLAAEPGETGADPVPAAPMPTQGPKVTASPSLAPMPVTTAGTLPPTIGLEVVAPAVPERTDEAAPLMPGLGLAAAPAQGPGLAAPVAALAQVAPTIAALVIDRGNGSTEIALAPEELGKLRVQLQPDGQNPERLVVVLMFERAETLDLFRRHAADLAETLRAAGYADTRLEFGQSGLGSGGGLGQGDSPGVEDGDNAPEPDRPLAGLPDRASPAHYREPGSLDIRL